MPLLTWLKILVVLAGPAVYGVQELRIKWVERGALSDKLTAVAGAEAAARADERGIQQSLCTARIADAERTFSSNAFTTVTVVQEAARNVDRAPEDKAALQTLCDSDPMCRDRRKKK